MLVEALDRVPMRLRVRAEDRPRARDRACRGSRSSSRRGRTWSPPRRCPSASARHRRRSASAARGRRRSGSTRSSRPRRRPGRISLPPPPAPQWFDCACPIVSFTSHRATSLWSQTGVPREETPTYSYISALRGSFWKNSIPRRSIRSRFSRPIFCSMSDSDIGKTLPFAQTTTASRPAASTASNTGGSSFDCGVGRNWLSITIASRRLPERTLGEARTGDGRLERGACRSGGIGRPSSGSSG